MVAELECYTILESTLKKWLSKLVYVLLPKVNGVISNFVTSIKSFATPVKQTFLGRIPNPANVW